MHVQPLDSTGTKSTFSLKESEAHLQLPSNVCSSRLVRPTKPRYVTPLGRACIDLFNALRNPFSVPRIRFGSWI